MRDWGGGNSSSAQRLRAELVQKAPVAKRRLIDWMVSRRLRHEGIVSLYRLVSRNQGRKSCLLQPVKGSDRFTINSKTFSFSFLIWVFQDNRESNFKSRTLTGEDHKMADLWRSEREIIGWKTTFENYVLGFFTWDLEVVYVGLKFNSLDSCLVICGHVEDYWFVGKVIDS